MTLCKTCGKATKAIGRKFCSRSCVQNYPAIKENIRRVQSSRKRLKYGFAKHLDKISNTPLLTYMDELFQVGDPEFIEMRGFAIDLAESGSPANYLSRRIQERHANLMSVLLEHAGNKRALIVPALLDGWNIENSCTTCGNPSSMSSPKARKFCSSLCYKKFSRTEEGIRVKLEGRRKFQRRIWTDSKGVTHNTQGYESVVMQDLDQKGFTIESNRMPMIDYSGRKYVPDFIATKGKLRYLFEVKSPWTLAGKEEFATTNALKFKAANEFCDHQYTRFVLCVVTEKGQLHYVKTPTTKDIHAVYEKR